MSAETTVEIRLSGEGMLPGRVRSREIAELIDSVEDMIASMVVRDHPELTKEAIRIGLKSIHKGSIGLEFSPNLLELTLPATRHITDAISTKNFGGLPSNTLNSLKKISGFTRKFECTAEFLLQNGKLESLATLTPDVKIPDIYPLSGETVIYGEITRVGGKEPRIQFTTLDGQLVYCTASKAIAKAAGAKLYTNVGMKGIAEWNSETFKIENFSVTEIIDYEEVSPSQAFSELSTLVGSSFDEIEDVNNVFFEIRYGVSEV